MPSALKLALLIAFSPATIVRTSVPALVQTRAFPSCPAVAAARQDRCSIRAERDSLDAAAMGGDRPNRGCFREVPDACDRVVSTGGCDQLVVGAEGEIRDAAGTLQCGQFLSRLHIPKADELARSGCRNESAVVAEAR